MIIKGTDIVLRTLLVIRRRAHGHSTVDGHTNHLMRQVEKKSQVRLPRNDKENPIKVDKILRG